VDRLAASFCERGRHPARRIFFMQIGRVAGHAVATVKHSSLLGWRLLVVQLQTPDGQTDGEPVLAVDKLGAGMGEQVILSNDGAGAREMIGVKISPVRWMVMGVCDIGK
jgi:ethanolamine utilization protein EutN